MSGRLNSADLANLGPLIASNLPIDIIVNMDPKTFVENIQAFKGAYFQLSAADKAKFEGYLQ